ncbi:MAG: zinc ribbon domain-containing protein [Proteobacteria bacterium]|nr:zinc ribbon domain-containing protein [Pseudomonadota bacterium]
MPIYEYECLACGRITSALIMKPAEEKEVRCKQCQGARLKRVLSRVVLHKSESQRLAEFDTRAPQDDSYYKDDRNIGMWAKKRLNELGTDLGPSLDETIEKARSGKILDDMDL